MTDWAAPTALRRRRLQERARAPLLRRVAKRPGEMRPRGGGDAPTEPSLSLCLPVFFLSFIFSLVLTLSPMSPGQHASPGSTYGFFYVGIHREQPKLVKLPRESDVLPRLCSQ